MPRGGRPAPAGERDALFMARALALAARGLGETNPNPAVGCVVVRGGRVVGEGFHPRAGGPHAEVVALREAGPRARGATLYVTLEPCAHHGRTPPCAPLVRDSGVARVVAAVRDPFPLVRGRGLALLRAAGVDVSVGTLAAAAERLNGPFLTSARLGRPYVLLKAATTLDGRIATASRRSRWITSAAQRAQARWLRRLHDAVLVGVGTALADDPLLLPAPRTRRAFTRVVLDSRLRLAPTSRLVRSVSPRAPVVVVTTAAAARSPRAGHLAALGVATLPVGVDSDGRLRLDETLAALRQRGVSSVMVEGGSEVLGGFLRARLVDEVALFRAPILLGGRGSLPAFGGDDPADVADGLGVVPAPSAPFPWPWTPRFELWRPRR
ncbi:MAG: bifunctional diaminohydroxyphosphoribosylaminopyrimidine deaminase/5-amino-6-(5-phosphoribosylamino)uracil reductase RibD [Vicinamibacteria bacterium]